VQQANVRNEKQGRKHVTVVILLLPRVVRSLVSERDGCDIQLMLTFCYNNSCDSYQVLSSSPFTEHFMSVMVTLR